MIVNVREVFILIRIIIYSLQLWPMQIPRPTIHPTTAPQSTLLHCNNQLDRIHLNISSSSWEVSSIIFSRRGYNHHSFLSRTNQTIESVAILEASANPTYCLDFNDIAGESPSKFDYLDECSQDRIHLASQRRWSTCSTIYSFLLQYIRW